MTVDDLLGRQFETRFRVVSIGAVPSGGQEQDRVVRLYMHGDRCEISLGELDALINTGFVVESGPSVMDFIRRTSRLGEQ